MVRWIPTVAAAVGAVAGATPVAAAPAGLPGPCVVTADPDFYSTVEATTIVVDAPGVFTNDDFSGCRLWQASVTNAGPSHGSVVLQVTGAFTYTPDPGFVGTDEFAYTVYGMPSDPAGTSGFGESFVSITVDPAPCVPVAVDDTYTTVAGTSLSVAAPGVRANDVECGDSPQIVAGPLNGTLVFNGDGSFEYSPNLGFTGVDVFRYSIAGSGSHQLRGLAGGARGAPRGVADGIGSVTITVAAQSPTTPSSLGPATTAPAGTVPPTGPGTEGSTTVAGSTPAAPSGPAAGPTIPTATLPATS